MGGWLSSLCLRATAAEGSDIPINTLLHATSHFSDKCKIGDDPFCVWYKANVAIGGKEKQTVVVKRLIDKATAKYNRWEEQIYVELASPHDHLSQLLGKSLHDGHPIVVYPYYEQGTLHSNMASARRDSTFKLSWFNRLMIATDVAKGLQTLHNMNIIHRDLTASHVYLTKDLGAHIGDFGLAVKIGQQGMHNTQGSVVATEDYLDPAYLCSGQANFGTDIFSFGVLLFVLVSGRSRDTLEEMSARARFETNIVNLWMDSELLDYEPDVMKVAAIAQACVNGEQRLRPRIVSILEFLKSLARKIS